MLKPVGGSYQLPSGRVIALGRLLLASLFLLAIWLDDSQPSKAPRETFGLLACYLLFAAATTVATWRNWWLDARLAGPAHAFDLLLFMMLVLLTDGYTSPFITFFMFLLLSAAIRWGWRATGLTALLLTLLYVLASLLVVGPDVAFDVQPFVIRTGHLIILSAILMWFGVNQWRTRAPLRPIESGEDPAFGESPVERGLRAAMHGTGAEVGVFMWRNRTSGDVAGVAIRDGALGAAETSGATLPTATTPFLYDLGRHRGLRRDAERNLIAVLPAALIGAEAAARNRLTEGLAIPVSTEAGEGMLYLEQVRDLSLDHLDLADQVAADVAGQFQRLALLKAIEEGAEARSRLTLARDLHDSVVQFLAGAAFRLEAIKRSLAADRDVAPDLAELKQMMLDEQRDLRGYITGLRSGPMVTLKELTADMRALAQRLSQQWGVRCDFSARSGEAMIPSRLHLDALQLMREAVANAVRHAGATTVAVKLMASAERLRIDFINDGEPLAKAGEAPETPASLAERVADAGGTLDLARGMGVTKVSISLPVGGKAQ